MCTLKLTMLSTVLLCHHSLCSILHLNLLDSVEVLVELFKGLYSYDMWKNSILSLKSPKVHPHICSQSLPGTKSLANATFQCTKNHLSHSPLWLTLHIIQAYKMFIIEIKRLRCNCWHMTFYTVKVSLQYCRQIYD